MTTLAMLSVILARLLPLSAAIVVSLWLVRFLQTRRLDLKGLYKAPLLAASMGVFAFSLVVTVVITPMPELTIAQVCRAITGMGVMVAIVNWMRSSTQHGQMKQAHEKARHLHMACVGLLIVLAGLAPLLVEWPAGQTPWMLEPANALTRDLLADTVNSNVMAGTIVLLCPLAAAAVLYPQSLGDRLGRSLRGKQVFVSAALLLGAAVVVLMQSRGALLALLMSLAVVGILRSPRLGLAITAVLGTILVGLLMRSLAGDSSGDASAAGSLAGLGERIEIWDRALAIVRDFPFFGIGMGTFEWTVDMFYPLVRTATSMPHAHNLPLQVAVDLGLIGLLGWLGLLAYAFITSLRAVSSMNSVARALGVGLLGSQVALVVHGLTDAVTWGMVRTAPLVWALWGTAAAASILATARSPRSEELGQPDDRDHVEDAEQAEEDDWPKAPVI